MTTAGAAAARPRGRYSHPRSVVPSASNSTWVAASVLSTVGLSPPSNEGQAPRCLRGASQMRVAKPDTALQKIRSAVNDVEGILDEERKILSGSDGLQKRAARETGADQS